MQRNVSCDNFCLVDVNDNGEYDCTNEMLEE